MRNLTLENLKNETWELENGKVENWKTENSKIPRTPQYTVVDLKRVATIAPIRGHPVGPSQLHKPLEPECAIETWYIEIPVNE